MKRFDRLLVVIGISGIALVLGSAAVTEAQPPIRIGASLAHTGPYAALGQNQLRGYQLCVKHANEKGGVTEAVRRAGSLDGERIRDAILKLEFNTVFGAFKVNADGFQVAHKLVLFQWQDGKKVIVWPDELAPGRPRFPTPPWSQRP
jgi:ABC-type branched-subunit amino acid transport system substrate-binding protein